MLTASKVTASRAEEEAEDTAEDTASNKVATEEDTPRVRAICLLEARTLTESCSTGGYGGGQQSYGQPSYGQGDGGCKFEPSFACNELAC